MANLFGPLSLTSTSPFVGRSAELEFLRTLVSTAAGEERRVVLIGGESGSGKSRLVREFAVDAASAGVLVLYGACDEVVHTPYGPFVQALDRLTRTIEPDELRSALGAGGGELTRLLPHLSERTGELSPPVEADPDTERHRLHTAVTELLTAVGRKRPVLLIIEDGHWADAPTLLLLRHLARPGGDARLLLLATFRDTEADMPETLSETLADLRRSEDVVRLRLGGLSGDDVMEFVRRAAGADSSEGLSDLSRAISDLTEGNAFLVNELWRALIETGAVEVVDGAITLTRPIAELGTPESVREVVSQRLSRLAPETTDLLELAATVGAEFELDIVLRAAGLADAQLLAALDEGIGSGMIEEVPSRRLVYRFNHELVRKALYDRLGSARRAELHLRVGEALESAGERSGRVLADLAHHFAAAAPLGATGRAVEYNLAAARAARSALAFDEAAARFRTALELRIEPASARAEAYLELGTASHRAGKVPESLAAFRSAAELARELASADLLARAAIGYEETCWRPGIVDEGAVELLEEAADALSDESSELRVALLSGLARALDFRGDHDRGAQARTSAIAMARRLGDRTGLATVLMRSYWSRGTSALDEILEMVTEARDLAAVLDNAEIQAEAMGWRVPALVALGEVDVARQQVDELLRMAEQTAQPFIFHVAEHFGSAIALCDGRLEAAEAMAHRSHEWSRVLTGRDASGIYGVQMFSVRREQGRLEELAPVVGLLAGDPDRSGPWRPGLVALLAELGMEAEAKQELDRVVHEGIDRYRESLWLALLTYLADACASLGDEVAAELLYPELEPFAGTNVMIGHLVSCYGAADRYLGMLASVLGEAERARAHFEGALELNRRMGAQTWIAHTAYEYARFLLSRRLGRPRPCRRAAGRGLGAGRPDRDADPPGEDRRSSLVDARGSPPGRALGPRGAGPRSHRAWAEQSRDRCGARDQRAHGCQSRAQHPAQDALCESDRGCVLRASARSRHGVSGR